MALRDRIEADIHDMLDDRAADGTSLDPHRDYEAAYHALSARHNESNRRMWNIYASMPDRPATVLPSPQQPTPAESTSPHNGSGEESHPKRVKLVASATDDKQEDTSNEDSDCPYGHAKDGPVIRPTIPHFDPIYPRQGSNELGHPGHRRGRSIRSARPTTQSATHHHGHGDR